MGGAMTHMHGNFFPYTFALDLDFRTSLPSGETFTRASDGTYVDSLGAIATATTDAARTDYNPSTLAALGLLIEGARTNKNTNYSDPTATTNVTKAGDAASTLTVVSDTTALAAAGLSTVCSNGNVYQLDNSAGVADAFATFAGTTGNTNPHAVSLYARGSGTASFRLNGSNQNSLALTSSFARKSQTFTPSNSSAQFSIRAAAGAIIYFVANVLEEGSFISSPILIAGGSATRAVELNVRSSTAFSDNWNANAMTVVIKFDSPGVGTRTIWQPDDNSANERYCLYTTGTTLKLLIVDGGSTLSDTTIGTIVAHQQHWCALRLEAGNSGASLDGAAVVACTAATLPTVDRRRLGASTSAGEELYGHIARERWVKQALPDSLVRSLAIAGGP